MKTKYWIILAIGFATILLGASPDLLATPSQAELRAAKIRAAYLLNFIRFTVWPEGAFESNDSPITVTVLGEDGFGSILDHTFESKTIAGRPLRISRIIYPIKPEQGDLADETVSTFYHKLSASHLVYISLSEQSRLIPVLANLNQADVLTVSAIPHFAEQGGMIGLVLRNNKITFDSNPAAIHKTQLKVSSKLLTLSRVVKTGP